MVKLKNPNHFRGIRMRVNVFFRNNPTIPYLVKWICISLGISLAIGSASAGFLYSLQWVTDYRELHPYLIGFLPLAGLAIGLLYHYYGKDVEAGNNLIIDQIHKPSQHIPLRMGIWVYLGTLVTHLFGGSAGREGTALQMASSIAVQITAPLKLKAIDRKILLIAAVAGGFGSVFGTPIAGAFFAMEFFRVGKINYLALFPAILTAVFADLIVKCWHVPHTHYHIDVIPSLSFLSIFYVILAGICFGICARFFSQGVFKLGQVFKANISYPPFRPLIGGIVVALIVFCMGTTKYIGLGIPTIVASFEQQLPAYDFLIKALLTILTIAAGFKGGEVTPLFFIGATLGNALGLIIPLPMGLLAGMGFVSVFAGASNTPIACCLMAMELFGVECGIFIGISCVVAYFMSGQHSIYRQQEIGQSKQQRNKQQEGKRLSEL